MRKIILAIALLSQGAFASSLTFEQGGWSLGGPLVVSFTGADNNLDGSLVADELTDFQATWVTPAGLQTQWKLANIEPDGFFFTDISNFLLFVRNPEYSLVNTAFEGEYLASVFDAQLFPVDSTSGVPQEAPEPGTFGLLGVFSTAIGFIRRRYARTS